MKKIIIFCVAITMLTLNGCYEKCKKTEAPEVELGLIIGGKIEFRDHITNNVITAELAGMEINLMLKKVYCNGTIRGPFDENYIFGADGILLREAAGYWSFKFNNLDDYMDIDFFSGGSELCQTALYYSELQSYNGTTAHIQYNIKIIWDRTQERAISAEVNRL
jgi:hypothetical protein